MTIHTDAAAARDEQIATIQAAIAELVDVQVKQAQELADLKATHAAEMVELKARVDAMSTPAPVPPPVPEPEPPAPPPAPPPRTEITFGNPFGSSLLTNINMALNGSSQESEAIYQTFVARDTKAVGVRAYHINTASDSGYSRGNGGTIRYELYAFDPVTRRPVGPMLATTPDIIAQTKNWTRVQALAAYPSAVWSQYGETGTALAVFRRMDFLAPGITVVGQSYAVVMRPSNADPVNHHVSIDFLRNRTAFMGAFLGMDYSVEWRVGRKRNGVWEDLSAGANGRVAIMEVYGPNVNVAQPYYQNASSAQIGQQDDLTLNVGGANQVRIRFTPDRAMTIAEVKAAAGLNSGPNRLTLAIEQGGATVGTVNLLGFPQLTQPSSNFATIHNEMGWAGADGLSLPVEAGQEVAVTWTASDSDFEVIAVQDGQDAGYFTTGGWPGVISEYSSDAGRTWREATVSRFPILFRMTVRS